MEMELELEEKLSKDAFGHAKNNTLVKKVRAFGTESAGMPLHSIN